MIKHGLLQSSLWVCTFNHGISCLSKLNTTCCLMLPIAAKAEKIPIKSKIKVTMLINNCFGFVGQTSINWVIGYTGDQVIRYTRAMPLKRNTKCRWKEILNVPEKKYQMPVKIYKKNKYETYKGLLNPLYDMTYSVM